MLTEPHLFGQKDQKREPLGARGYKENLQEERDGEEEILILYIK